MKKNEQVYDNIKHKTPMRRMLEAQAAAAKAAKPKPSTRKTKED